MAPEEEKQREASQVVLEVGNSLAQQPSLNKRSLVKLLKRAEEAFMVLGQSSSLKSAVEPLSDSLTRHDLLHHTDKDVRVLVTSCLCGIIRVLAPDPPYSDEVFRDIFKLIISMFGELADTKGPYFSRRVQILETIARLKCCVLMLDIGCDDLVVEMFNIFFSVLRDDHEQNLFQAMLSIMTLIIEEKVPQPLLDVILRNLLKEEKGAATASFNLAVSVIQHSAEKLEPFVRGFLTSSILERDAIGSELKEYYHEIIYEIYQCAPQMLLAVIPNLTHELLTDQVDVRIKAVNLLGKLFALPGCHVAHEYRQLFVEFLKRFSDKSAEVRISALQCVKAFYIASPSCTETLEVLASLEERLLDFDEKVRTQAVTTVCELAKSNLKCIPPELILRAIERLRDKKVSVRRKSLQKLLALYRDYCTKCSESCMKLTEHFEQIPCKAMVLCYDKDCKDFRPQNMELVLAEDLFPVTLPLEERTKHWISLFSVFSHAHVKALTSILSQKWRLQMEMQTFLALREEDKESTSDEVQKRIKGSFRKMSASFVDPPKAEECFQKLQQMKDNIIFKDLRELLKEGMDYVTAHTTREKLLKDVGDKHPLYEFLRMLSLKCSVNIIGSKDVVHILSDLSRQSARDKHLESALVNFLQMLSKAGQHISIEFSDVYPSLERICLEGTRLQSKHAISTIAALSGASEHLAFSDLCEVLLESLKDRKNISTVLQSLGCLAQYCISAFEPREKEINIEINQIISHETEVQSSHDLASFDDVDSGCSASCKLKIYGLKTLVKSFLPYQGALVRHQMKDLFIMLTKMLPEGEISDEIFSSGSDKAHIRLAAAKSVLKLASKWDRQISPQTFHLAILKAKDPSSLVRRFFLDKIHKLLKGHAFPSRYACAFALASSDCLKDVQADSMKYLEEFIGDYSKEAYIHQASARQVQEGDITKFPEYIVVFLIHILAHDPCFPSDNCQDEEMYARFCSPLVVMLQALVGASSLVSTNNARINSISRILNIFIAIKKTEDAVDVSKTHKLHILAEIGVLIVKALSSNSLVLPTRIVLLPSPFYKANSNFLMEFPVDEDFAEKVVHIIERDIAGTGSSLAERIKTIQEVNLQPDSLKDPMMPKQTEIVKSKKKEETEKSYVETAGPSKPMEKQVSTRQRNRQVVSPGDAGSMDIIKPKTGVNGSAPTEFGRKQVSSSRGSIISKTLSGGSRQTKKPIITQCASLEENNRRTRRKTAAEPCNIFKTQSKKHPGSKDVGDISEARIGQRIKVWSPVDKCFYSGSVEEYDSQSSSHKIMYDNGEVELVRLENENWEIVKDVSSSKEDPNKFNSMHSDSGPESSISNLKEFPSQGDKASEPQLTIRNKRKGDNDIGAVTPIAGVRKQKKKAQKMDSVTSEVIDADDNIARRTRSQKF